MLSVTLSFYSVYTAEPGSVVLRLSVAGFAPNSKLHYSFGTDLDDQTTDSSGSYVTDTFFVAVATSSVSVAVTDASGNSASCSISLATVSVSGSGAVGSTMSVSGSGFGANKQLTLNVDAGLGLSLGGTTVTDADGAFSGLTFVVPPLSADLHCVWVSSSAGSAIANL